VLEIRLDIDQEQAKALIARMNDETGAVLGAAMHDARAVVTGRAMRGAPVRTGNLRRTLQEGGLSETGQTGPFSARAVAGSSAEYAPIIEFGGVIPAHEVRPRFAQALHFFIGGHEVFAKRALIPDVTRKPHPFLTPALEASKNDIRQIVIRHMQALIDGQGASA